MLDQKQINQQSAQQLELRPKSFEVEKNKKIKKSILKKKHTCAPLIVNPALKHIYMIGHASVINEEILRSPDSCQQSLIMNNLKFKKVTSLQVNENFLTINLKMNSSNYLPAEYLVERFNSFQNSQLYQIAKSIDTYNKCQAETANMILQKQLLEGKEKIHQQFLHRNSLKEQKFYQFLQKFKNKKFFAFFFADCKQGFEMKKIVVSLPLMNEAGLKLPQILNDYIKHKKVSFQLFSSQIYQNLFNGDIRKMLQEKFKQQREPFYQSIMEHQMTDRTVQTTAQLVKKKYTNQLQWEQNVRCNMVYHAPKFYISLYEINDVQDVPIKTSNFKNSKTREIQFDQQPSAQRQLEKFKQNISAASVYKKGSEQNQFQIV